MKKFNILIALLFFTSLVISPLNVKANENIDSVKEKELHKKSELSSTALNNMKHSYADKNPIIGENKSTGDQFLENTLLYKNFFTDLINFEDLLINFNSKEMAQHFKSKNVDVYAIRYSINCYGGEIDKTACTYGGVTPHEGNKLKERKKIPINLWINGVQKEVSLDKFQTDKKNVTVQELDAQARRYLQKDLKLYNNDTLGGKIQRGKIEFDSSDGSKVSYDLFDVKGDFPEKQLRIYSDNKTLSTEHLHIDIYLYEK
ncbi:TPA: staphylococcal enterotoxin type D [Staphylococcus aureus]